MGLAPGHGISCLITCTIPFFCFPEVTQIHGTSKTAPFASVLLLLKQWQVSQDDFFLSDMQLRLSHTSAAAAACPKQLPTSNGRRKKRKTSLWSIAANLHLLRGTGWNEQGGTHPSKKGRKCDHNN